MLKGMFKEINNKMQGQQDKKVKASMYEPTVPDGMFTKCAKCNKIIYSEDIIENNHICPNCNYNFRINPKIRINMIIDKDTFEECDVDMPISNPLDFPGYEEKLKKMRDVTSLKEAVVTGFGKIDGTEVAIGVMSSEFFMGSMGYVVGEKITRLIEKATEKRVPLILVCTSGGARMQEGMFSLMQMAKTAQALKKHDEAGLLYISLLTDPTTGGVTASFAMLGDIILAEPRALIGFAGPRVIQQTIGQKLPEGFQSSEFLLEHGFVDKIVKREKLKQTLSMLVRS